MDAHKGVVAAQQGCLEELQVLEGHTDRVWCLAWSPSGTLQLCPAQPCGTLDAHASLRVCGLF